MTPIQPTAEYVEERIERVPESGCWLWTKGVDGGGYARGSRNGRSVLMHRWLYIHERGDVGDLDIDHLCRVRCCINPDHLEPVTNKENALRGISNTAINAKKTHCPQGHPYDAIGKRNNGKTYRFCRTCKNAWNRVDQVRRYYANKEAA